MDNKYETLEYIFKNQPNCYYSIDSEGDYVKEWTNNETLDDIIFVGPYPFVPHVTYFPVNESHYKWCGPLLLIAEYFGKLVNVK